MHGSCVNTHFRDIFLTFMRIISPPSERFFAQTFWNCHLVRKVTGRNVDFVTGATGIGIGGRWSPVSGRKRGSICNHGYACMHAEFAPGKMHFKSDHCQPHLRWASVRRRPLRKQDAGFGARCLSV